jgi:hypothetical protein
MPFPALTVTSSNAHEAGTHAQEVDLAAQERADPGENDPELPVV